MRDSYAEERFFPGIDTLNYSQHLYGEVSWDDVDDEEEDEEDSSHDEDE